MPPPTSQGSFSALPSRLCRLLLLGLLLVIAGCQSRGASESDGEIERAAHAAKTVDWNTELHGAEKEAHADIWERIRAGYKLQDQIGTNPRVERQRFGLASRPASIQQIAERSSPYIHYIVERLEENDMPLELALLPMIESSYNPLAYSPAHAAGLWQFIPSTGRHFNLRQTSWYDGRRDILASTNAAISYLKRLHDMFNGDWLLALASYNAGEGTVSRAIERNQRKGLPTDYWNLPLPRETQDYVPKLLAVSQIIQSPNAYGVSLAPIADEPYFEKIAIRHQLDLSKVAAMTDVDKDELLQLNPAFKRGVTLDGPLHLLVPADKADGLSESLARMNPESLLQWQRYQVRHGDSLQSLAGRHQVTVATLRDVNRLSGNHLRVGQNLLVPQASAAPEEPRAAAAQVASSRSSGVTTRYKVRRGDTLWSIARRHNVSANDLQRWNNLRGRSIKAGQVLTLHASRSTGSTSSARSEARQGVTYYKVRRGDSLSVIAQRFSINTRQLKQWNPSLGRTLKVGQTLALYLKRR